MINDSKKAFDIVDAAMSSGNPIDNDGMHVVISALQKSMSVSEVCSSYFLSIEKCSDDDGVKKISKMGRRILTQDSPADGVYDAS